MPEPAYRIARIAELERPDGWIPIRSVLGVQSFGINGWTAREAGDQVIPEHREEASGHEELYLVIDGHSEFTVNGERVDAPAGTLLFIPDPAATRAATAVTAGTTRSTSSCSGLACRTRLSASPSC